MTLSSQVIGNIISLSIHMGDRHFALKINQLYDSCSNETMAMVNIQVVLQNADCSKRVLLGSNLRKPCSQALWRPISALFSSNMVIIHLPSCRRKHPSSFRDGLGLIILR
ncbi:unnamed protein product [Linum trigynum]|uniref:Uncharacterized protein n=1 Tax=Linum trigynum TaxID=586398 RepID=A0AAV2DWN9_9ROSI